MNGKQTFQKTDYKNAERCPEAIQTLKNNFSFFLKVLLLTYRYILYKHFMLYHDNMQRVKDTYIKYYI